MKSWVNAQVTAVTTTASRTSLATAQRTRPHPWVQANRNVPDSSSRATTGAPRNTPSSTGTTSIRLETVCAPPADRAPVPPPPQYCPLKSCASCWHTPELAGRQLATLA